MSLTRLLVSLSRVVLRAGRSLPVPSLYIVIITACSIMSVDFLLSRVLEVIRTGADAPDHVRPHGLDRGEFPNT